MCAPAPCPPPADRPHCPAGPRSRLPHLLGPRPSGRRNSTHAGRWSAGQNSAASGKTAFLEGAGHPQRKARPPYRIENEFFVVEVAKDGTLTLLDKRDGRRYTGLNRFLDGGDCGDEYNYCPPAMDRFTSAAPETCHRGAVAPSSNPSNSSWNSQTPVALAPDRKSRCERTDPRHSYLDHSSPLTKAVPRVDIRTTVDNTARDHRLRVHFPAPFAAGTRQPGWTFRSCRTQGRPAGLR